MKRIALTIICAILAVIFSLPSMAKYDEKFFRKAAEKVWSMDLPQFDPKADLTDSIFRNASTVCIARFSRHTAEYESNVNVGKYLNTGRSMTRAILYSRIYRVMLKLNDTKAVEDYTDFDIDVKSSEKIEGYTYSESNMAFGARIYKPDGAIVDIDPSEAFSVTAGKNDKEVKRKLAIPGLAPGDVLEYFYYEEMYLDEVSLPEFRVNILSSRPTRNFTFECEMSPYLTLEYAAYNGAPLLSWIGGYSKEVTKVGFSLMNLEAIDTDMPFFQPRRQLPYLSVLIMNNTSTLVYHPKSARVGGVRTPSMQDITLDAANSIADTNLPDVPLSRAVKIAKDWRKAHPEATERQYIDAAWMSLFYVLSTESRSFSDRAASVYFVDMLKKLKISIPGKHALVTGRNQAPVNHLTSYKNAMYATLVGDSLYAPWPYRTYLPGDVPGLVAGEEMIFFNMDRKQDRFAQSATVVRIPQQRALRNIQSYDYTVSVDPDDEMLLEISGTVTLKGAAKTALAPLVLPPDYYTAIEDYLGIPANKRHDTKLDSEKLDEAKNLLSTAFPEAFLGVKLHSEGTFDITSIGCTPDNPNSEFAFTAVAEEMVNKAGNNLMVNLGKLLGKRLELTAAQRNREIEAILDYPSTHRMHIKFNIPDGFTVNEESLKAMTLSVNNKAGNFATKAELDQSDPGEINITVMVQYRNPVYSVEQWPELLALIDARNEFTGLSILLTPAK